MTCPSMQTKVPNKLSMHMLDDYHSATICLQSRRHWIVTVVEERNNLTDKRTHSLHADKRFHEQHQ